MTQEAHGKPTGSKLSVPLTILLLVVSARADSVTLTDGKVFRGTFLQASAGQITWELNGGSKRRFRFDQIVSIQFDHLVHDGPMVHDGPSPSSAPIERKYRSLMFSNHPLGNPTSEEQETSDQRGRYRSYQNGVISYAPQIGAYSVQVPIADVWISLGAERSELGYPTADAATWPDGRNVMLFEHGAVFWDGHSDPVVEIRAH